MENIETFYNRIPKEDKNKGSLILYFIYYCECSNILATIDVIKKCYDNLALKPYSNIAAFLNAKTKGRKPTILKTKTAYKLTREQRESIAIKLNNVQLPPITDDLIPLSLFDNTRKYIVSTAEQMCRCYDFKLYDASLVMMRKLVETLIIECFERYGASEEIKKDGHYVFLSELIPAFIESKHWTAGRNITNNIAKIKKWGDTSAHTRRYIARKNDFNEFKAELRIILEDIILLIDYPSWNLEKKDKNI